MEIHFKHCTWCKLKFIDLDWIENRVKGFCCKKCEKDATEEKNEKVPV